MVYWFLLFPLCLIAENCTLIPSLYELSSFILTQVEEDKNKEKERFLWTTIVPAIAVAVGTDVDVALRILGMVC